MQGSKNQRYSLLLTLCLGAGLWAAIFPKINDDPLFEQVPSSQSGITFSNTLKEDLTSRANLFDFDYFYNGGGVGIGDINNDGLLDIFFSANQGPNALFLNKGNLTFEDISKSAGINAGKNWSNGVSMADVNQDGWLDIYVSQGGPEGTALEGKKRKNLLYINNGDLSFSEEGQSYGLADEGASTQSVFFDYDRDGDLDCFVGNENYLFGLPPDQFYQTLNDRKDLLWASSSHLYQNNGGKFKDVSEATGILMPSFALGPVVSDINEDGWLDIYVANDYYVPDQTFINQGDGTFVEEGKERFSHTSFYGMGADIADINNDGHLEVYVLDMASSDHYRSKTLMRSMNVDNFRLLVDRLQLNHQYMFNSLQLNNGNGNFDNISHFSGTAKTDWSWAGLMADYDQDGLKDIYVTNGYRRYALDNDFQAKVRQAKAKYKGKVPLAIKEELYQQMPSEKLRNYAFQNQGGLRFKDKAEDWGMLEASYSNGGAYADLDNDGDLDLVINNIDAEAFLYKNLSQEQGRANFLRIETKGRLSEDFPTISIHHKGKTQVVEAKRVRGYLSSLPGIAVFGIGESERIDTLRIEWPSGNWVEKYDIAKNTSLSFSEEKANLPLGKMPTSPRIFSEIQPRELGILYKHRENLYDDFAKEILLPYKQSTLGPFIASGDINGDQKVDFFVGGAAGKPGQLYVQTDKGFQNLYISALERDKDFEDMEALFMDIDADGDEDLFVVSGGNAFDGSEQSYGDRLYVNQGKGKFIKAQADVFGKENGSGKTVTKIDFDRDGDWDLVVGNRIVPQNYPKHAPSKLYRNDKGRFKEVTWEVIPDLQHFGIINSVIATDFDGDKWPDLVVVGEWTHIGLFKNHKGTFRDISNQTGLDTQKGWWFHVAETDVNKDGKPDYVIGNLGLNSKFKASQERAFKVFANDFDNNGSLDIVLSSKQADTYLPVRGRECSSQQMPFIQEKFPTYHEFASASLIDIYGDGLDNATELTATEFASLLLINEGKGNFSIQKLPPKAQLFPILSSVFIDLNRDGFEDMILAGNIYDAEVETPRLDAGNGLVLISNGRDNYTAADLGQYALQIDGAVKQLHLIEHKNYSSPLLFATENNGPLHLYKVMEQPIKEEP